MAERYTGTGYKIWINRRDTTERITDENIWAGNVPGDGKSKISSGLTGADSSYVIFETWEDVLNAIGIEPVTLSGTLTQEESGAREVGVALSGTLTQEESGSGEVGVTLSGTLTQNDESGEDVTVILTGSLEQNEVE